MEEDAGKTGVDMDQDQPAQTALVQYKPPKTNIVISALAETAADVLNALEIFYETIESAIKRSIDKAAQIDIPSEEIMGIMGIRERINVKVARVLNVGIASMRKLRILESTDMTKLPELVEGRPEENLRTKEDVNDFLDSRIGAFLPFMDEMKVIGTYAFGKGIPAEKLIEYFKMDQILDIMISELLSAEDSRFRGTSFYALVRSVLKSLSRRLKRFGEKMKKQPVTDKLEDKIKRNIAYFSSHYNPHDREDTISKFAKELVQAYPEYDVAGWLKKNRNFLKGILRGEKEEKTGLHAMKPVDHIPNIVREVYEECGRANPKKFIELNVPTFLAWQEGGKDIEIPPSIRKALSGADITEPYAFLDLEQLEYFFEKAMPRVETERNNLTVLRSEIILECLNKMESMGVCSIVLRGTDLKYSAKKFGTVGELQDFIKGTITSSCKVVPSSVDVGNLLVDPLDVPDEIKGNYDICFKEKGELKKDGYDNFIRRLFGHTTIAASEEDRLEATVDPPVKIRKRITRLFLVANEYIDSVVEKSGIPADRVILKGIKEINDYAELIKIACKDLDKRKRFEARRKIELAVLIYNCMGNQRYVNQDHDARAVKAVLESKKDKLRTEKKPEKIRFIDYKDGKIKILEKKEPAIVSADKGCIREELLIPVEFAGIHCHLMPADEDGTEYMSQKTLPSMVTNLINDREKRGARDLTDLIRMTFVVDDQEKFDAICRHLGRGYIGFGMTLTPEDRYGKMVRVRAVGVNKAKSEEYKALRYVVDIPVESESGTSDYFALVEIRILFAEDFAKEKSEYNNASHKKYEERRRRQVLKKLIPEEIYGEEYKTITPHEDDISCRVFTVLKDREDYPPETPLSS